MSWTTAYKAALRQLSTPSLDGEVLKLENSVTHLRRSNDELKLHGETEKDAASWVGPVIAENADVIAKQVQQVELVKAEIAERGAWSDHGQETALNGNGVLDDAGMMEDEPVHDEQGGEDEERMQVDDNSDGVHL
jgi:hypothetical protein